MTRSRTFSVPAIVGDADVRAPSRVNRRWRGAGCAPPDGGLLSRRLGFRVGVENRLADDVLRRRVTEGSRYSR